MQISLLLHQLRPLRSRLLLRGSDPKRCEYSSWIEPSAALGREESGEWRGEQCG